MADGVQILRRNRPGSKAKDFCRWPDQPFEEMDNTLAVQQLIQQTIRRDPSNLEAILKMPEAQEEGVWKYEHLRQFCMELNGLTVRLQSECKPETCTQMTATEQWIFLCAAHKTPKECPAIDYTRHTLDGAACLLNSNKYFPSRAASPACTELEIIMLDWMGKAIGLPPAFLALEEGSNGGGVIEGSASESVLVSMLAARAAAIKRLKHQFPSVDEGLLLSKLIAYCSKEAHSCVEKAAMICFVKLRILQPDEHGCLRGEILKEAMEEDEEAGLVPFFVSTTLGTTSCCSFDNLPEIGPVVRKFPSVWLHIDAAYAGSAFLCPEHKYHLAGVEYADSFNTNPNKFMLTSFDCSLLWVTNRYLLTSALVVDPLYLQHCYDHTAIDYRHWGVPLSRRFRSLKLWFMLRSYGIIGLQKYVRRHCELAKYFEKLVKKDERFEVCNQVKLGLVCFRLIGGPDETSEQVDELNKKLLTNINASGKIHMVPASVRDHFVIRFCVVYQHATREDIEIAWDIISDFATELLEGPDKERDLNEERARRNRAALAHKRSFFVRMVSDPKIYNPAINKTPPPVPTTPCTPPPMAPTTPDTPSDAGSAQLVPSTPKQSSWISWPLAFFFQSVDHDANDLPLRFRHLDTMVRLKSPNHGRRGSSPCVSPERRAPSPSNN